MTAFELSSGAEGTELAPGEIGAEHEQRVAMQDRVIATAAANIVQIDADPTHIGRRNVERLSWPSALTATLNWYRAVGDHSAPVMRDEMKGCPAELVGKAQRIGDQPVHRIVGDELEVSPAGSTGTAIGPGRASAYRTASLIAPSACIGKRTWPGWSAHRAPTTIDSSVALGSATISPNVQQILYR